MGPLRHSSVVILLLSIALPAAAARQHARKPVKTSAPAVQPQVERQPAPTSTPEEGPSSPADVTFQSGQLTILARNSTMGDVLTQVGKKTGAAIDMPPSSTERVVGQFGPGAPRDVLAQLLNGSHYDYVLMGSPADANALKKIVLMVRPTGPEPAPPPQNNNMADQELQQVPDVEPEPPSDDATPDVAPEQPPPIDQEDQPQGEQPQQPNMNRGPIVKTPEQLLRELQQQQQQQQQQQNQGQPQQ